MALGALASRLGDLDDFALALEAACAIAVEWSRAEALAALAPRLTANFLPEALEAARGIGDVKSRGDVLVALAPRLTFDLMLPATKLARSIDDAYIQGNALVALALRYADLGRSGEAIATIKAITDEQVQTAALRALSKRSTHGEVERTFHAELSLALGIADVRARIEALIALIPRLSEPSLIDVTSEVLSTLDVWAQSDALAVLALRYAELGRPDQALATVRRINLERERVESLVLLARRTPAGERDRILHEALSVARSAAADSARILVSLASDLTEGLMHDALVAACFLRDEADRADVLAALAPRLQLGLMTRRIEGRPGNNS